MIDYELKRDSLLISHFNEKGGIGYTKLNIPERGMYKWKMSKNQSLDGEQIGAIVSKYPNKYSINQFGQLIEKSPGSPNKYRIQEIMHNLPDAIKDKIHSIKKPDMYFVDIETEVIGDAFPDIEDPINKVFTIAICSTKSLTATIMTIKTLTPEQVIKVEKMTNDYLKQFNEHWTVEHILYDSETRMLDDFMNKWVSQMPALTGWNFIKFDWAYLANRSIRLGINIDRTSPTGAMKTMTVKDKYNPTAAGVRVLIPKHRLIFDMMQVVEKWDRSIKLKSSSKLDYIAGRAFGLGKLHYDGTLMELYERDFVTYCAYNIIDTILVKKIHEVLSTYTVMSGIASAAQVEIGNAMFASQVLEPMFHRVYLDKGMKFVRDYNREIDESKYGGAFVLEPNVGLKLHCMVDDFASLFPMIIDQMSIGIDTYVGDISKENESQYIDLSGEPIDINFDNVITTAFGTVFEKSTPDNRSIPATLVGNLFGERDRNKKIANAMDQEIGHLKHML